MLSKPPLALPVSQTEGTGLLPEPPTASPPSMLSKQKEIDLETRIMDDPLVGLQTKTRIEAAADSEVDSHLRSLVRMTSLQQLARTANIGSLKTISERDLKEWIKEALRRVISTTTSLGEAEREQLLTSARHELSAIMQAHAVEGSVHTANASALAVLIAEREETIACWPHRRPGAWAASPISSSSWSRPSAAAKHLHSGSATLRPSSRRRWPSPSERRRSSWN